MTSIGEGRADTRDDHRGGAPHRFLRRAPRISVLADRLEDDYEWEVLRGAAQEAADHGAQLFAFVGSELGANKLENQLFDLVGPVNSDGIVVLAGALLNEVGVVELERFVARFESIPISAVAAELTRCHGVVVDESPGMGGAVQHLVTVHGRRRLAFIEGPPHNPEAQRRRRALQGALGELGLYLDDALVVPGAFSRDSGHEATRFLLDEHGVDGFDAIVACDDYTALGALDALEEAGVACPGRIAVVGFDDLPPGRRHHPALATVQQPLRDIGRRAVMQVLGDGTGSPVLETLASTFIPRESCGCLARWESERSTGGMPTTARRRLIAAEIGRVTGERLRMLGPDWERELVDDVFDDVMGGQRDAFRRTFYSFARTLVPLDVDLELLNDTLSVLRGHLLELFGPGSDEWARADTLLDELRVYVATAVDRAHVRRRVRREQAMDVVRSTAGALISSFELEQLTAALASSLPRLGIERFYLVAYRPGGAQLMVAIDGHHPRGALPAEHVFDPAELVPEGYLPADAHSYVLKPLFLGDEPLGYIVLSLGSCPPTAYAALREQISAAVKGAELRRQRDDMAGLLDKVAQLRGQLSSDPLVVARELDRILEQASAVRRSFSQSPARALFNRSPREPDDEG